MQRRIRPEFSVTEANDVAEISERERAKRLALFVSTVWEQPEVFRRFVGKFSRVEDLLASSALPEVVQYGTTPDDRDSYPYAVRATYATTEILKHGDDLEADPDPETAEAMRAALEGERRRNPQVNARLLRLGVLASQISVYDTLGTLQPPDDYGNESGTYVFQRVVAQEDIA